MALGAVGGGGIAYARNMALNPVRLRPAAGDDDDAQITRVLQVQVKERALRLQTE